MTGSEIELWQRIDVYSLDDRGSDFSFTARLARDNQWSLPFATRVVDEYKRFVFLAISCDHPVTPSDEVDQAWHLHMVYTRSYWDEFCGDVLRCALHHGPTRGGQQEAEKFVDQYEATQNSYRDKFGEPPPADIWPASQERFDRSKRIRRICTEDYWLVRKPNFQKLVSTESLPLVAAAVVPAMLFAWSPFNLAGRDFLVFYAVVSFAAVILGFVLQRVMASDGISQWELQQSRFELSSSHVAYLAGGKRQLLQAAVCELLVEGWAEPDSRKLLYEPSQSQAKLSSVSSAILEKLRLGSNVDVGSIQAAARVPIAKIRAELAQAGLIQSKIRRHVLAWATGIMVVAVLALGVMRIVQAVNGGHFFGFLLLEMAVFLIVSCGLMFAIPFRTKACLLYTSPSPRDRG